MTVLVLGTGSTHADLLQHLQGALLQDQGVRLSFGARDEPHRLPRDGAVLLLGDSPYEVVPPLLRLRQGPDTALSPILVSLAEEQKPGGHPGLWPGWPAYADAVLRGDQYFGEVAAALSRLRRIYRAVSALPPTEDRPSPAAGQRRRQLLLRYLLTREVDTLQPRRDPASRTGHSYAPLDLLGGPALHADLLALSGAGLLQREFYERLHVCPACDDARLLFREVCTSCLSADVRHGGALHHYRCGHVGREDEFRVGASLRCPACAEPLRHIGIDYERPAVLLTCNGCDQTAAEGVTHARCLGCGHSHAAEAVAERTLFSYRLTEEGRAAAQEALPASVTPIAPIAPIAPITEDRP